MKKNIYNGPERRKFVRLNYTSPLACKVCKKTTISKLLQGYTSDISQTGLLCNIKDKVNKNDILWLSFDRGTLSICQDLERKSFIYQNGVIGRVVRLKLKKDNSYDVGVQFITREEKNLTHIYPKIHFLKDIGDLHLKNEEERQEEIIAEAEEPLEQDSQDNEDNGDGDGFNREEDKEE